MLPFVLLFLLAGVALLIIGRNVEREAKRSARWPVVVGQLEHCEVVERPGTQFDEVSSWQLQLRYSYAVHGKTYHSTRYAFGYGDGRDDEKHRRIADALKSKPLTVHYDPVRPSESVISTEAQTNLTMLGLVGMIMAAVSALIGFVAGW